MRNTRHDTAEGQSASYANHRQHALVEAAYRADIDVSYALASFVPKVRPDQPVQGDQWRIAKGTGIARLGTSTGSLADDRAIAYGRLTGLADWAEEVRRDTDISVAISQSRQSQRQHGRLTKRANELDAKAIQIGNEILSEDTLAIIYNEPFEAMVAMREMLAEAGGRYQKVVNALYTDPEQFGSIRKESVLGKVLARPNDISPRDTLKNSLIPDLRRASLMQINARRARHSADEFVTKQPVNHELLAFDDALTSFNRELISPDFAHMEADITMHQRHEALSKTDPVAALELAQTKAQARDGSRLWHELAAASAEYVRDDNRLADEAELRGIVPELSLPRNARRRPGPQPKPR